ncbi:hypothetical protein HNY73_002007 [Argiope bruennichi]|uniref:Uncharacterized protein n=1 Tax=Argiope bruennichi TaxID=94029 RepID=A0A8T0FSB5_ARGBR|nr:hypothetical protein HNY73_002007 [Argiope bruennichi]
MRKRSQSRPDGLGKPTDLVVIQMATKRISEETFEIYALHYTGISIYILILENNAVRCLRARLVNISLWNKILSLWDDYRVQVLSVKASSDNLRAKD